MYNNFAKPLAELEFKRSELKNLKEQIYIMEQMSLLADSIERINTKTLIAQLAYEKKIDDLIVLQDSLTKNFPSEKNKMLSRNLELKKKELKININKAFLTIKSNIVGVENIKHPYVYFSTFQNLLDYLYLNHLNQKVDPYTYGKSWVLQSNKIEIKKLGENDNRTLKDIGIIPGETLELQLK